jgi:ABC transporter family protein
VAGEPAAVRELIGLTGQFAAVDELLTGRENLEMFGHLFKLPGEQARRRAGELLERFDLAQAADRPARTYSGGMRRRLGIASSLLTRPQVLFLDEPTTGLDPRSRNEIWAAVRELRHFVRQPDLLVFSTIQPVIFVLLFVYVFGGAIGRSLPHGVTYVDFLLPGIFVQSVTFGASQTAVGLKEDLTRGVVDRFPSAWPSAGSSPLWRSPSGAPRRRRRPGSS